MIRLPSKDEYRYLVEYFRKKKDSSSFREFSQEDPDDKTTVFDFVDDNWIDYTYSNIEKVIGSDLYKGDGTIEYRVAYICTEINLLHQLPNANKRTSIFVMWLLLLCNLGTENPEDSVLKILVNMKSKDMYKIAKETAERGTQGREESIQKLTQYLKDLAVK